MNLPKSDLPALIDLPGTVVRQLPGFGAGTSGEAMAAEYFSLAAGTDIAPLLVGLEGDLCQAPHWGYLLTGEVAVRYADGSSEQVSGGSVFHWPGGHTVAVLAAAEIVLFSPEISHGHVLEHLRRQLVPTGS